jgi:hypothetical protein
VRTRLLPVELPLLPSLWPLLDLGRQSSPCQDLHLEVPAGVHLGKSNRRSCQSAGKAQGFWFGYFRHISCCGNPTSPWALTAPSPVLTLFSTSTCETASKFAPYLYRSSKQGFSSLPAFVPTFAHLFHLDDGTGHSAAFRCCLVEVGFSGASVSAPQGPMAILRRLYLARSSSYPNSNEVGRQVKKLPELPAVVLN